MVGISRDGRIISCSGCPLVIASRVASQGSDQTGFSAEKLDFLHLALLLPSPSSAFFLIFKGHLHPVHPLQPFSPLIWYRIVDSRSSGIAESITYLP